MKVWLEPLAPAHLLKAELVPDLDTTTVHLATEGSPAAEGLPLHVSSPLCLVSTRSCLVSFFLHPVYRWDSMPSITQAA